MRGPDRQAVPTGRSTLLYQLEYNMKTAWLTLLSRLCCGLSVAALTLALSFDGSRAPRAEGAEVTPQLQETIASIMTSMEALEARLDSIEASVNAFSASVTSVPQMLCVADGSGDQTCITKAQLDALLHNAAEASLVAMKKTDAQPSEVRAENLPADLSSDYTGTVSSASPGAAVAPFPEVGTYEEPAVQPDE
jgi:hypothetical protein